MSLRLYTSCNNQCNVINVVNHNHNNIEVLNDITDIDVDTIEFVGLCTDICVVSNALMAKAYFYNDFEIAVDSNCCAGVTPESHEAALTTMRMCQINVY